MDRKTFSTPCILMLAVHMELPDNSVYSGLSGAKALDGSSMNKTGITISVTDLESFQ